MMMDIINNIPHDCCLRICFMCILLTSMLWGISHEEPGCSCDNFMASHRSQRFCHCDQTLRNKSNLGCKGVISAYMSRSQSNMKGRQLRHLEVGTEAESTDEWCLLACFPLLAQPFLIQLRTTCLGVASSTMSWTLPYQSLIRKMPPTLAFRPI